MKLQFSACLLLGMLALPAAFAGSVLVYRNSGWRISDWTWWMSLPSDPQWLAVDLGARQLINRVRVYAKENVKTFKIQDDGAAWTDVAGRQTVTRIASGDVKAIFDLLLSAEVQARHVRFFGTERDKPEHGYGIVELAVFRDRQPSASRPSNEQ